MLAPVSSKPVFHCPGFVAREISRDELPLVQAYYDANPEYTLIVNGRRPNPGEAAIDFDERPPPHLGFTRQWFLGLFDDGGALAGVAIMVADLCAPAVWHLALFHVATALHGSGAAQRLYDALQQWVAGQGAEWLRLGVVKANPRGERFWRRQGFVPLRLREGVDTGGRVNDVLVMARPLRAGADLADYLRRVPRDAPGSTLP